jgi:hypothetical protein
MKKKQQKIDDEIRQKKLDEELAIKRAELKIWTTELLPEWPTMRNSDKARELWIKGVPH